MKEIRIENVSVNEILSQVEKILKSSLKNISNSDSNLEIILTREDVSKLLKVSYPTLNNWAKKRILIPYNIGNRIYYNFEDIKAAMKPIRQSIEAN